MTKKKQAKKVTLAVLSAGVAIPSVIALVPQAEASSVVLETTLEYAAVKPNNIVKFDKSKDIKILEDILAKADGSVYTWSAFSGASGKAIYPEKVGQFENIKEVFSKRESFFVLTEDGKLYVWGKNTEGIASPNKDEVVLYPKLVEGIPPIKEVAYNGADINVITTSNEVYSWGKTMGETPTKLEGVKDVKEIHTIFRTHLALTTSGDVYAWGTGEGELGLGYTTSTTLKQAKKLDISNVAKLHTHHEGDIFALTKDGQVYSWGDNDSGVLGQGSKTASSAVPKPVLGLTGTVVERLKVQKSSVFAFTNTGETFHWGKGYPGNGSNPGAYSAVKLPLNNIVDAYAPRDMFVLTSEGDVYSWGTNDYSTLGHTSTSSVTTPKKIEGLPKVKELRSKELEMVMYALTKEGDVYSWGKGFPALGQGLNSSSTNRLTPVKLSGLSNVESFLTASSEITLSSSHEIVKTTENTYYGWGSNAYRVIGKKEFPIVTTPTDMQTLTGISGIELLFTTSSTILSTAVNSDGEIFQWGSYAPKRDKLVSKLTGEVVVSSSDVVINKLDDTTLKLEVEPVIGAVDYTVLVNGEEVSKGKENTITIKDIVEGLTYDITLEVTTSEAGKFTKVIPYTHGKADSSVGSPETVELSNVGHTKTDISWSTVSGANGYIVYANGKEVYKGTDTSITVNNLQMGETYEFTVSSYFPYTQEPKGKTSVTKTLLFSDKITKLQIGEKVKIADREWYVVNFEEDGAIQLVMAKPFETPFAWKYSTASDFRGAYSFLRDNLSEFIKDEEIRNALVTTKYQPYKAEAANIDATMDIGNPIASPIHLMSVHEWEEYKTILGNPSVNVALGTAAVPTSSGGVGAPSTEIFVGAPTGELKYLKIYSNYASSKQFYAQPLVTLGADYAYKNVDGYLQRIPFEPVQNLKAVSYTSAVKVSWSPLEKAVGYEIFRNGMRAPVTVGSRVTSFDDTDIIKGLDYDYTVVALYPNGGRSPEVTVSTNPQASKPEVDEPNKDNPTPEEGKTAKWTFSNADAEFIGVIPNISVVGSKAIEDVTLRNVVWVEKETVVTTAYGDVVLKPDGKGNTVLSAPNGIGTATTDEVVHVKYKGVNFLDITIVPAPKLNFKVGKNK